MVFISVFTLTEAEKKIIEQNINLIYAFAHSFNLDPEEYWEPLTVGLVKAVHDYEESDKKYKLSTFIYNHIRSEVLNFKKKLNNARVIPIDKLVYYQDENNTVDNMLVDSFSVEHDVISKLFIVQLFSSLTPFERYIAMGLYKGYSLSEIHNKLPKYTYRQVDTAHKKLRRKFLHNYSQTGGDFV